MRNHKWCSIYFDLFTLKVYAFNALLCSTHDIYFLAGYMHALPSLSNFPPQYFLVTGVSKKFFKNAGELLYLLTQKLTSSVEFAKSLQHVLLTS